MAQTPETIEINFKPLGQIPGTGTDWYHETLLYTNSAGQEYIATCYATGAGPTGLAGTLSQLGSAAASGGSTSWGTLGCASGSVTDPAVIQALGGQNELNSLINPGDPTEIVGSGSNLSQQWAEITQAEQEISASNFNYSPLTLNSNSAAETGLTAAGIAVPQDLGLSGSHWCPGSEDILPTSLTPADDNQTVGSDGTVTTITEYDSSGNITGSIGIDPTALTVDTKGYVLGTQGYDVTTVTGEGGSETAAVSGTGANLTLSDATVNMAAVSSATVNGGGNTVTGASGDAITLSGSDGTADTVSASNATVNVNGGAQVNFAAGSNNDTIALGADSSTGNTANVNGSNNNVTMDVGGETVALTGGNNTVTFLTGYLDTITVAGTNGQADSIDAHGDYVNVDGGAQAIVSGDENRITLDTGSSATLSGASNSVAENGNNQVTIDASYGYVDWVNNDGAGDSVTLQSNVQAAIQGSQDGSQYVDGGAVTVAGQNVVCSPGSQGRTLDAGSSCWCMRFCEVFYWRTAEKGESGRQRLLPE
jgi:hypothetical protein